MASYLISLLEAIDPCPGCTPSDFLHRGEGLPLVPADEAGTSSGRCVEGDEEELWMWMWGDAQLPIPGGHAIAQSVPWRWSRALDRRALAAKLEVLTDQEREVQMRLARMHWDGKEDRRFPNASSAAQWLRSEGATHGRDSVS
mmetsp:Transcript_83286/g.231114  ORF Transcript_83286/g.231114 Transcript_83286/m.231114 type:complete len:143 (-) Transcript_83286:80-508(-)